jgi:pimeloyl-ACP methyl ester carboxylesterase
LLLIAGYGAGGWYLWANQRELIFTPTHEELGTPADLQLEYEDVWLPVGDGAATSLHGWWLRADSPVAPTVLYLHGNDLNIGASVEPVARFRRMGFSVLVVDYRGYGRSGGSFPSESQVYEDAEIAWNYLVRELHADPGRTVIYGHSLGGAIAIDLALHHREAAGLILEGTFTSIHDIARIRYWMFPIDGFLNQRFNALGRVPKLRVPVLFIHGTADTDVPYTMSEQLFAAAREPKELTLIAGGAHEDSATVAQSRYTDAVLDFTRKALGTH